MKDIGRLVKSQQGEYFRKLKNVPFQMVNSKMDKDKSYKFRQCNNILHNYSNLKSILDYPRAILVPIRTKLAPQQLHFYLKWYLSLIELSFSHLHIQLYSFSINPGPQQLQKLLQYSYSQNCEQQKQQLLFEILPDNAFISILQERASKLTVSQLSQLCEVEIKEWGKIMLFSEGINGLVIWVTVDELPWLKVLPGYHELFKSPHSAYRESCKNRRKNPIKLTNQGCKGVVEVQRSDLGYSIFRHANCKIKTANEFLQRCQEQALTMYIIDFESKKGLSSEQMVSIIKQEMEFVFQIFNEQSQQSHKLKQTNEYIVCTERISELLSLDGTQLLSKLFRL